MPGYFSGFGPCYLAFWECGGSVRLWEGWLLEHLEQYDSSRKGEEQMLWVSGKAALLETPDPPVGKTPPDPSTDPFSQGQLLQRYLFGSRSPLPSALYVFFFFF